MSFYSCCSCGTLEQRCALPTPEYLTVHCRVQRKVGMRQVPGSCCSSAHCPRLQESGGLHGDTLGNKSTFQRREQLQPLANAQPPISQKPMKTRREQPLFDGANQWPNLNLGLQSLQGSSKTMRQSWSTVSSQTVLGQ